MVDEYQDLPDKDDFSHACLYCGHTSRGHHGPDLECPATKWSAVAHVINCEEKLRYTSKYSEMPFFDKLRNLVIKGF